MQWSEEEQKRYSRHFILEGVGEIGQEKISSSKVLIVGAGGLGSPIALYLAAAGVGEIGIIDADLVDVSNLQRQVIHTTADVDTLKVESAKRKMQAINPHVKVTTYPTFFRAGNALDIISPYDCVVDGTDNFAAKFLINDACVLANKPYSHGGILRFHGQSMTIKPKESACYACIFDSPPKSHVPTCASAGILGAVAGILGSIQATEVLKIILGMGDLLCDRMLTFDAKTMVFRHVKLKKNPKCRVCGENFITTLKDYSMPQCSFGG